MTVAEPESVARFRQYLRIKTVHPTPAYQECAEFLVKQAGEIGLEHSIVEPVKGKPIVILKLAGSEPSLKSILLSSHTDVVPVFEEFWTHPPFGADREQTEDGDFKIFARGSQDMKVTGSQYLEALRLIVASGQKLKRNVYAVYSPDEEIGSKDGAARLIETEEFKNLNIGFDLDESVPSPINKCMLLYAERTTSQVTFTAHGNTGHGSQFIEGTAIEKLLPVINEVMKFRDEQNAKYQSFPDPVRTARSGEVTSVNLTMLGGGKQANVVPATYSVTFDIRVTPLVDLDEFRGWLKNLATTNGVEIELLHPDEQRTITNMDKSNPLINAFFTSLESQKVELVPMICPGATDARYIRSTGVPAFGFNPMINHKMLIHDHDEHVIESEYLRGIEVYRKLICDLANVSEEA